MNMFKENQERTPCFLSNADFWRCCLRPRPPSAKALHQPRLASTKDSFAHGPLAKTQFYTILSRTQPKQQDECSEKDCISVSGTLQELGSKMAFLDWIATLFWSSGLAVLSAWEAIRAAARRDSKYKFRNNRQCVIVSVWQRQKTLKENKKEEWKEVENLQIVGNCFFGVI